MAWIKEEWVDDDGSLVTGTPFDAARMNNIELGIEEQIRTPGLGALLVHCAGNPGIETAISVINATHIQGKVAGRIGSNGKLAGFELEDGDLFFLYSGTGGATYDGIWEVTNPGTPEAKWTARRPAGVDTALAVERTPVFVLGGREYGGRTAVLTSTHITLGTTVLTWRFVGFRDWGVVTTLPGEADGVVKGDYCTFAVTAGVRWRLEYTGEATYPWTCIGGRALYAAYTAAEELMTESETPQTTNAPTITVPLAMEAQVEWGAQSSFQEGNGQARINLFINGSESTPTTNSWTTAGNVAVSGLISPLHGDRLLTLPKSAVVTARYYRAGGSTGFKTHFYTPYLKVDPNRVG